MGLHFFSAHQHQMQIQPVKILLVGFLFEVLRFLKALTVHLCHMKMKCPHLKMMYPKWTWN